MSNASNVIFLSYLQNKVKEVLQKASGVYVSMKKDGQNNVSRYKIGSMRPPLRSILRMVPGFCSTTQLKHMHLFRCI